MGKTDVVLSIVVIAHDEGKIVERTINSLVEAAKKLEEEKITYHFLVNIDNGDAQTTRCLKRAMKNLGGTIYYTNYGDPGLARNSIVRKTKSEYIAIVDADDMVSSNWFVEGLKKVMNSSEPIIVHPGIEVRFDEEKVCSVDVRVEYENKWYETLALIEGNRWCSIVIGRKESFVKNHYSASKNGFGYEDYYFNCVTVAVGIRHAIVERAVAFCLQKEGSVSDVTHRDGVVLPYNRLFDLKTLQKNAKENKLPEVVQLTKKDSNDKKVFDLVRAGLESITGCGLDVDYINAGLSNVKVARNSERGDLTVGILFCRMIIGINLRFLPREIIFWNEGIDRRIGKLTNRFKWIIATELVKREDIGSMTNMLDFEANFGLASASVQDVVIERLIVQSKAKKIIENDFSKSWFKRHKKFIKKNHIRVCDAM